MKSRLWGYRIAFFIGMICTAGPAAIAIVSLLEMIEHPITAEHITVMQVFSLEDKWAALLAIICLLAIARFCGWVTALISEKIQIIKKTTHA